LTALCMSKKLASLAAACAFSVALIVPFSAAALTPPYTPTGGLTEAQVSAIISLLQSFGADASVIAKVRVALGGNVTPPSSCLNISRNFTLGSTGNDVSNLQNYLIGEGYLTGTNATGYYGSLTAQAVGKLQVALGIVSSASDAAYGLFGPRTRAAIGCGGTTPPPPGVTSLSASPTSGSAPLRVQFSGSGLTSDAEYIIEYGDGTNSAQLIAPACENIYGCPVSATHTYATPGTYTATLQPYAACMWSNPRCLMATQVLGSVTIHVNTGY
ncbi:MAG: peptidoglycan-binding protein, partial [bacterium]|nr:peptidoglycan-binding protein [bacterium]